MTINEIVASFLTSFVDKNAKPNYTIFKDFEVDLGNSEFQLNSFANGSFFYSKDPNEDLTKVVMVDFFSISSTPERVSENEAHAIFNASVEQLKANGFKVNSIKYGKLELNNHNGYQVNVNASNEQGNVDLATYAIVDIDGTLLISEVVTNNNVAVKKEIHKIIKSIKRLD